MIIFTGPGIKKHYNDRSFLMLLRSVQGLLATYNINNIKDTKISFNRSEKEKSFVGNVF